MEGWEILEETVSNADKHVYPWDETFLRDVLKEYEIVVEVYALDIADKVYRYNIMNIPTKPNRFSSRPLKPLTLKGDGKYHKGYSYEVVLNYLTDGTRYNDNNTWKVIDIIPLGKHKLV